jgi:hypothetical protein
MDPEKIDPAKVTLPSDRGQFIGTGVLSNGALTLNGVHRRTWHIGGAPVPVERRVDVADVSHPADRLAWGRGVTCPACAAAFAELEAKVQSFLRENEQLTNELSGALSTIRTLGRQNAALRGELTRRAEDSPRAEDIRTVLDDWQQDHPRAKTPTGGKRWRTVNRALALGHGVDELLEALAGLRAFPYVGSTGRASTGRPEQRYDDVEHALRDESTIERFRRHAQRATAAPEQDPFWTNLEEQDAA